MHRHSGSPTRSSSALHRYDTHVRGAPAVGCGRSDTGPHVAVRVRTRGAVEHGTHVVKVHLSARCHLARVAAVERPAPVGSAHRRREPGAAAATRRTRRAAPGPEHARADTSGAASSGTRRPRSAHASAHPQRLPCRLHAAKAVGARERARAVRVEAKHLASARRVSREAKSACSAHRSRLA